MRRVTPPALLALTVSCRSSGPAPAPGPDERLAWVDPTRCLAPCSGPTPDRLMTIDAHGMPADGPFRIDRQAQPALAALIAEAYTAGLSLRVISAYRDHTEQERAFSAESEVGRFARPGHSEHELGLAVDLDVDEATLSFLKRRGPVHGFVTSYPAGHEHVTGFRAEPWHQRYVGVTTAGELTARGLTLQEHLAANPSRARWGDCSDCRSPLSHAPCTTRSPRCEGEVLQWCMAGDAPGHEASAAVDCGASGGCCDAVAGRCGPCRRGPTDRPPTR